MRFGRRWIVKVKGRVDVPEPCRHDWVGLCPNCWRELVAENAALKARLDPVDGHPVLLERDWKRAVEDWKKRALAAEARSVPSERDDDGLTLEDWKDKAHELAYHFFVADVKRKELLGEVRRLRDENAKLRGMGPPNPPKVPWDRPFA
jgi:hypothetical protein